MILKEEYKSIDESTVYAKEIIVEAYYENDTNEYISSNYKQMYQRIKEFIHDDTTYEIHKSEFNNIDSLLDTVNDKLYYDGFNSNFAEREIWRFDRDDHSLYTFVFGSMEYEDGNFIYDAKIAKRYSDSYPIRIVIKDIDVAVPTPMSLSDAKELGFK